MLWEARRMNLKLFVLVLLFLAVIAACKFVAQKRRPIDTTFLQRLRALSANDLIQDTRTGAVWQILSVQKMRIKVIKSTHRRAVTLNASALAHPPLDFKIIQKTDGEWNTFRQRFLRQP
jgi:hypothetical protein